nr:immunoglobulin heavy chain junction region [Macaca mulatta]MOV89738.1 immunoglobulin heavy chain junction region [Macaca mulatta]MOV90136.1 immunoglobulin heavy chain junction region [Macaca mulatta]MOV90265.1 immunoglobulin heavy chain junction region [Macaca mulatta]MOV91829.1 immunoglobulin heavy chain junction region [Macaca mulatta]
CATHDFDYSLDVW